jgi:hypothetical protein
VITLPAAPCADYHTLWQAHGRLLLLLLQKDSPACIRK